MTLLNPLTTFFPILLTILIFFTLASADVLSAATNTALAGAKAGAQPYNCGRCSDLSGKPSDMVLGVCTNAHPNDTGVKYLACNNQWCGLCMVFAGRDCQGDILITPEKGHGFQNARGGKSHYCL
ncbi:hypothetical protein ACJQWK_00589 [Exserohilum turcicum]